MFANFIFILIVVNLLLLNRPTYLPSTSLWTWLWITIRAIVLTIEKISPPASCTRGEEFSWDFSKGQIWTEDSGSTGARFSRGVPLSWMKDTSESSGWGGCSLREIFAKHALSFAPDTAPAFPFGYYHGKKFSLVVSFDLLPQGRF